MNNSCKTAVATAVAGGYVLGRTRKAKAAFAIATLIAGRRIGLSPRRSPPRACANCGSTRDWRGFAIRSGTN